MTSDAPAGVHDDDPPRLSTPATSTPTTAVDSTPAGSTPAGSGPADSTTADSTTAGSTTAGSTTAGSTTADSTTAGSTTADSTAAGGGGSAAFRVRAARPDDAAAVYALIKELAVYEREPDAVTGTLEDLRAALFNPHPRVHCLVLEAGTPNGPTVVGTAIWYVTFSTWRVRHGIWLEDLYVQPAYRRFGAGRALLESLAGICVERGYARLEWWVLDWNEPAHGFYRSIGAVPQDEWTVWRVDTGALKDLAVSST